MRAVAVLVLASTLLSGCGVRSQDRPEQLLPEVLPSELRPAGAAPTSPPMAEPTTGPTTAPSARPSATPSAALTTVTVYLVDGGRLVPEARPARRRAVQDALDALLATGQAERSRRSAVPPGTVVERLRSRGPVLSIELSAHFAEVRGRDQVLAVAQLVWTATEFPPIREVEIVVDGRRLELPVDEGEVSPGPAGRDEYFSVGPAR